MLQHQINVIRNVINRLENSLLPHNPIPPASVNNLQLASRDKLRVLSESLIEILLHFSLQYGIKVVNNFMTLILYYKTMCFF